MMDFVDDCLFHVLTPTISVLQIRVEPFEEYMVVDDRPSFPMNFFLRLKFTGCLDRSALGQATWLVMDRHPFLTSLVRATNKQRPTWVNVNPVADPISWNEGDGTKFPSVQRLDIMETAGFCLHVLVGQDSSELILQLHHACCDGIGAYQIASELLVSYSAFLAGEDAPTKMPSLDLARLSRRTRFGMTAWKWIKSAPLQLTGLVGVWGFLLRNPIPLLPHEPVLSDAKVHSAYPASVTHSFDRESTEAIQTACRQQDIAVNDLLARDLFLAIDDFRSRSDVLPSNEHVRLNIPVNMRNPEDSCLPATNIMSFVFLDRRPSDCGDKKSLLKSIHDEMECIKRRNLGLTFLMSLRMVRLLPGGLARMARKVKCESTAVLSNIGRTFEDCPLPRQDGKIIAGNVILKETFCLSPFRPYTCIAIAVTTYSGRMMLALHYDSSVLQADQARDLIDTYTRFLRESFETA
ncbi:MAG: hypothetical protein N2C12_00355 [Planctomycetales bacterium]